MNCYPENTQICIDADVFDAAGEAYSEVCNATYKLTNADGDELFSGSMESVQTKVTIVIGADLNEVPKGSVKDLRRLVIRFTKPEDDLLVSEQEIIYFIRSDAPLIVGDNSFVTYENYLLIASATPHLDQFGDKSKDEIVVALQEAHDRLMRLRFRLPYKTKQENVGYVSEVAWRPRAITDDDPLDLQSYKFSLEEVTPEGFKMLPEKFRKALAKAQVIEANTVLEPTDSIEERRRKGVILETINEVKMMFSSTTPVNQKICRDALRVLSPYLDTTVRIRRV